MLAPVDRFPGLAENARAVTNSLQRTVDLHEADVEVFPAHKQRLIHYLERFVEDLVTCGAEIATLLEGLGTPHHRRVAPLLRLAVSPPRSLGTFAVEHAGSAHAVDHGPLATLTQRAVRALTGTPPGVGAQVRRATWAAGLLSDELSSHVLVLNLPGDPGTVSCDAGPEAVFFPEQRHIGQP